MKKRYGPRLVGVLVVALSTLSSVSGCEQDVAVSGEEVRYHVSAQGAVAEGEPGRFVNGRGWTVELTSARALVGPIYFYSGEARASLLERLIGINQAYACAAHAQFQSGTTLGETTLQFGVDLLAEAPTVLLEDAEGVAGEVRSVELHLQNPGQVEAGNEMAAAAPQATYEFAGTATKDQVSVPFTAAITLPEDGTHQIVDSIPAQMELEQDTTLKLHMQLDRLFRDVDFEPAAASGGDQAPEPVAIAPGSQAYSALTFSLRSRDAFVWEASP